MKWIAFFLSFIPMLATTIVGYYVPGEGEKPQGIRIVIGKYEATTNREGVFWFRNIPPGKYTVLVGKEKYGEIRVEGRELGMWIYPMEKEIYLSRNREFFRKDKALRSRRDLRESLFLAGNVDGYGGKLSYSLFKPGARYYISGVRTFPDVVDFAPYSSVESEAVEHGRIGKITVYVSPARSNSNGFELGGFFFTSSSRKGSLSFGPSEDMELNLSLGTGGYRIYMGAQRRNEDYSFPEGKTDKYSRVYVRGKFPLGEIFFLGGREDFEGLRDRVNDPVESSWSGRRDYWSLGMNFSYKSLSLSAGHSYLKRALNPYSFESSFYDSTYDKWWGGVYKGEEKSAIHYLKFSTRLYTHSFLATNNFVYFGGYFTQRNVKKAREYPVQFLYYHGEPSFALLRSAENMDYSLYRAGLWIEDSLTSGNINFNGGIGYEAEWFSVSPVSAPSAEFPYSPEGVIPETKIENAARKTLHVFSARGGLSYDPFRNGFLVLRLYSAFRMVPFPVSAVEKVASTLGYSKYMWNDDGDGTPEDGEFSYLFTHLPISTVEGLSPIAYYVEPERNYDFGIGISSDLPLGLSLDVDFLYRLNTRLYSEFWYIKRLVTGWGIFGSSDWYEQGNFPAQYGGLPWYSLVRDEYFWGYTQTTNRNNYDRRYSEWRFNLRKSGRFSFRTEFVLKNLSLKMDPSLSPFDPTNVPFTYNDPYGYAIRGDYLSPYLNSRWSFLFNSSWMIKPGLSLSFLFRARDGYIIPAYYIDTSQLRPGLYDYPQGLVAKMGEFRLPTWWRVDARVSKVFNLEKFRVELSIYVYNLTNNKIAIEAYEDATLPEFLNGRVFNEPRCFMFGIKIRR